MTPQECLFRALQCERLAASSSAPAVKKALLASAALWRKRASVSRWTVLQTSQDSSEQGAALSPVIQVQMQVQQQQQQAEAASVTTEQDEKPKA